jgi:uncharacterized damage-inducible protein DinB
MLANTLLIDALNRVQEVVHQATNDLSIEQLTYRPEAEANSIAWLIWHLTRIQDDHMAELRKAPRLWQAEGWAQKFALPFDDNATGYGQTSSDVAMVEADAETLLDYYDAVHQTSIAYIEHLQPEDYDKVVDTTWDPPVTLAVRLISIISDDLQHAGQAAYIRGLLAE